MTYLVSVALSVQGLDLRQEIKLTISVRFLVSGAQSTHKLIATDYSEARMMQVINLPYLLQSLVSAKAANCVQPQSKGTVHHYPANCNGGDIMEDRSSTANSVRMDYQCAGENGAARNGMAVVQVKREVMNDQTETGNC